MTGEARPALFPWLHRRRLVAWCRMIAAGSLLLVLLLQASGLRQAAEGGPPLVTDFLTYFALPRLVREQSLAAAYDPVAMAAAERDALAAAYPSLDAARRDRLPPFLWLYPPSMALLLTPLGHLPYWPAYGLFIAATLALFLAAIRAIRPGSAALWLALALPAVFLNTMFGQNGFLTAGLLGLGLAWLPRRPLRAGLAFGLLTVKPQLGLLLPLALAAGHHWRALAAAALSAAGLAGLSLLAWGLEPWRAFLAHAGDGGALLQAGGVPWSLMPTVFPGLRLLGLPESAAWAGQAAVSLLTAGAVARAWRRPAGPDTHPAQAAALCLGVLLVTPFAHAYDLTLTSLPLFWLWPRPDPAGDNRGRRRAEILLILLASLPLLAPGLGKLGLPAAPPVLAAVLALALRRLSRLATPKKDPI